MVNKVNQDTYARVLKMLLADPVTAREIVEEVGLHLVTVQSLLRTFKKHKLIYVCAWEQDAMGRDAIPIYKLGSGKDKLRRKLTPAERQARYKERKMTLENVWT